MLSTLQNKLISSNNKDLLWQPNNTDLYNKFTQHIKYKPPEPIIKNDVKVINTKNKVSKKKILPPLSIILNETNTFKDFVNNIKEKLVTFITSNAFNKVFGITKTSEIMSGIVNNRWNKSTALFISFLFEKSINYNNTIINYYKNSTNNSFIVIEETD